MSSSGRKIVITGGCGFLGSHLATQLTADGADVHLVDNLFSGRRRGQPGTFHEIDILDREALARVIDDDTAIVFHLAAHFGHPRSLQDASLNLQVNLQGTLNVLELVRAQKTSGRIVFASTFTVYGAQDCTTLAEDLHPRPTSPYDVSKLAGEHYVRSFHKLHGVDGVIVRISNMYGPRDPQGPYRSAVSNFIGQVMRGEAPTLHFEGKATRDFVYVGDVVRGLIRAGEVADIGGEAFNLCTGIETTVHDVVDHIIAAAKSSLTPTLVSAESYYTPRMRGCPDKSAATLGFKATTPVAEGIRETVAWCLGHADEFAQLQPYSYHATD